MATVVCESLLSASIEIILNKLTSPEILTFIRLNNLQHSFVQNLNNTLCTIESFLNDAEFKQFTHPKVKQWLHNLKHAIYIADDLLDHISTITATPRNDNDVVPMFEHTLSLLESILKDKDSLGLHKIAVEALTQKRTHDTPSIRSVGVVEDVLFGRDGDKEAILKLLSHDDVDGKISVIPIVGMRGVGKTTLVQSVRDDENLMRKFDVESWVSVLDNFDEFKVIKTILEQVTERDCNINDMQLLHCDLKENLTMKKFLIVFEDVFIEDYNSWNSLMKTLQCGDKGSKILVTTHSGKVASMVQTFQGYYFLEQLSDEDCWSVFANHACLSPEESSEDMDLQEIGREIVRKCKGLPLAAQSLGGLLRGRRDIRDWKNVLHSNIWETESKIIPALRICYQHLSPYLKRCFVYCSLFPKEHRFYMDGLILLWMAEDLLQPSKNGKTLEEVGYEYFNDLVSISFLKRPWSGGSWVAMHDLVHDLATFIGGEFYFRAEDLVKETKIIGAKARHLSFTECSDLISENFEFFGRTKFLRTFYPMNYEDCINNEKATRVILSNLKYLRVLSFNCFTLLHTLPDSIGELIHLRYLNLSGLGLVTLPDSLCNLYNLQTLILRNCVWLTKLPNDMHKLVNLRHLDINGTRFEEMPRKLSRLNHLQHLSYFVVGKHEDIGIKELGTLSNLHGSLSIRKLENVTYSVEASEAKIMDKEYLEELRLEWSPLHDSPDADFTDSQSEMDVLGKLQPNRNLVSLYLSSYTGTRFPEWVGDPSYHSITQLSLSHCQNCCILPPLGQLRSLKNLTICRMNMLKTIGSEFFKKDDSFSETPFPSLEYLVFMYMPCLEMWHHPHESYASFPVLKSLVIYDCPRLQGDLPTHLPALETIEIVGCNQLASSLPTAPAIHKIHICGSNKVFLQELPNSLGHLEIEDCSSAISFPGDCLPASLNYLSIRNCRNLDFPKQNHLQESLRFLTIDGSCDSLTTLPLENLPNLSHLTISKCENLESLSASKILPNLFYIGISDCPKFVSFPSEGLCAPNLTSLHVSNCVNLKSLPCHANTLLPKLQEVNVYHCPEMETFPEGGMPLA